MRSIVAVRAAASALAIVLSLAYVRQAPAQSTLLPREKIVLANAKSVDAAANSAVLPLYKGHFGAKTVWYIITDSSDPQEAQKRGLLFAPRLARMTLGCPQCIQHVTAGPDGLAFEGVPDFSPARHFKAGRTGFPPEQATPGAVSDAKYSPFVQIKGSDAILNISIVATGNGPFDVTNHTNTHDRVLAIDAADGTVTMLLAKGFSNGQPILYTSTEASDPVVATMERATYVPLLAKVPLVTRVDIYVFANGQTGRSNADAQGLAHAALDGELGLDATSANAARLLAPLNVLASFPPKPGTSGDIVDYTPVWDANVAVWSAAASETHRNSLQTNQRVIEALGRNKSLSGPEGKELAPVGFVINCPPVAFLEKRP